MEPLVVVLIIVAAVVTCFACCCLPCCITSCQDSAWKRQTKEKLEAASEIVETAKGPIEFYRTGDGPYILLMHGTPGSHDGYSLYTTCYSDAGLGVICPSRPGYGRTPLSSGPTAEEAADLMAALLDKLSIGEVVIMGISGGGPTALNFARKYPNRCKALITEVAVTGGFTHPHAADLTGSGTKFMMGSAFVTRMTSKYAKSSPANIIKGMMDEQSTFTGPEKEEKAKEVAADPERIARLETLMRVGHSNPVYPCFMDGLIADVKSYETKINFEEIKVPTLVVHGDKDGDIPYSQA